MSAYVCTEFALKYQLQCFDLINDRIGCIYLALPKSEFSGQAKHTIRSILRAVLAACCDVIGSELMRCNLNPGLRLLQLRCLRQLAYYDLIKQLPGLFCGGLLY